MKGLWPELSSEARRIGWIAVLANAPFLALLGVIFGAHGILGPWTANRWAFPAILAMALSLQGFMVIWALSYRLEGRVRRSLQRVTRDAQNVLGLDLPISTEGHVGQDLKRIQEAFGVLLDQIRKHERELAATREDTERKVEERTLHLARAKEVAEETVRLKSQFLASVSHELRTPLHAILSFSRFGIDRTDHVEPEKLRGYFMNINDSGTRLLTLLDDLLDLAKLEAGKAKFSFVSDDLLGIVNTAMEEFECLAEERQCVFTLDEAAETKVQVDRRRMIQVIRNILSNAIKFSPVGGTIHVRVGEHDGGARVEIGDEGEGVPREDLDGIFEKFDQGRKISSSAGGTGLGLSICREIVNAHDGEITVRNEPDGGAVFTVSIPLDPHTSVPEPTASVAFVTEPS